MFSLPFAVRRLLFLPLLVFLLLAAPLAAPLTAEAGASEKNASEKSKEKGERDKAKKPSGRIPWTTSRLRGSPDPPSPYVLRRVFPKLQFRNPVVLTNAPGTRRLFVVELAGRIYSFLPRPDVAAADLAVDLSRHIKGLSRIYGLTFHPRFQKNRYCYVCYVLEQGKPDGTRVSRFRVTGNPPRIDPRSEKVLLSWLSGGHNGGCLKFGPEGYLYISTGDGAGAFPPDSHDTGQNIGDLLASILRIDVDHEENGRPYRIPPDNPFVRTKGARGEVWSYGHRNPWKMSFDPVTGDLWVGDVGWEMWEMIDRVQKGSNYGWSIREAKQPVHPERQRGPTPIVPPTLAHSHTEARSITGGFVYRGDRLKKLTGVYLYGDYVTGKIWGARHNGKKIVWKRELLDSPLQIICFGTDNTGELYVVSYDGTLHQLEPNTQTPTHTNFPRRLSETGLFESVKDHRLAPGVVPYVISAEPWMDGATALRALALPGFSRLGIHTENNPQKGMLRGEWKFPANAVLMKTVLLELEPGNPRSRRRVETQILHRNGDTWNAYNYIWNDEQTDAVLQEGPGRDRTFLLRDASAPGGKRRQTWHHASRTECLLCHTTRGGSVYGFRPENLDRLVQTGSGQTNQLALFREWGLYETLPGGKRERLPDPYDARIDLTRRARAYLHVNCATCHRRGGGGTAKFELLFRKSLKENQLLSARPSQGAFRLYAAEVVAPGDPYRSVLYYRMAKLGRGRMPHFGSNVVDERGLRLIHDWIASLPATDASSKPAGTTQQQRRALQTLRAGQTALLLQLRSTQRADDPQWAPRLARLLSSTSGALRLATEIDRGNWQPAVKRAVIQAAAHHADVRIRDLFERFLPEEERTKRLGTVVDAQALLRLKGNAARGRQVFFRTAGVSCKTCHKIDGQGGDVGPDLSHIGKKYSRAKLLESILEPSKTIDEKYRTYLVQTTRGKVFTGLLISRTDRQVVLKDAQGKRLSFDAEDVELLVPQRRSLMPELLLRDMTAPQVADLIEFLFSRK